MTRAELRDLIAEVLDVAPLHAADVIAALDAIPAEDLASALGLAVGVESYQCACGEEPLVSARIVRKRGRP